MSPKSENLVSSSFSERWREAGGLFRDPRIQGMTWQWVLWVFFSPLIYPRLLARKAHKLGTSVGTNRVPRKVCSLLSKDGERQPSKTETFWQWRPYSRETPGKKLCCTLTLSKASRMPGGGPRLPPWTGVVGASPTPPCWSGAQGSQAGTLDCYPSCSDEATFSIPLPHCSVEATQGTCISSYVWWSLDFHILPVVKGKRVSAFLPPSARF